MKEKPTEPENLRPFEHPAVLPMIQAEAEPLENHVIDARVPAAPVKRPSLIGRVKAALGRHKKHVLLGGMGAVVLAAATLTLTDAKYAAMNLVAKADVAVVVVDSVTKQPVPEAVVSIGPKWVATDNKGIARLSDVPYGGVSVEVVKFAYGTMTHRAKITADGQVVTVGLTPTGTPVRFKVTNSLTGLPLEGAKVSFGSADALSDKDGGVSLSIPPQRTDTIEVSVSRETMQTIVTTVRLNARETTAVSLTPGGKVYFLSKRTGKIDVMKSNLDGSEQKVVLAGTGKEDPAQTVMLASRDWKYLALKSKRDGFEKLFLIDTYNDSISVIDDGKARFTPIGWSGYVFTFTVDRQGVSRWESKGLAIKGFDAGSRKLSVIDENQAEGTSMSWWRHQVFTTPYVVRGGLIYGKYWTGSMAKDDKQHEIIFAKADGSQKKVLKTISGGESNGLAAQLYAVNEAYFKSYGKVDNKFYAYKDGRVKELGSSDEDYSRFYPTQLLSPNSKATVWYEPRDGKNTLLVGDGQGKNGKEIVSLGEYVAYGWYSDDYILVSKNNSELYIMPKSGPSPNGPLKITDYHKPEFIGYGYGGF